MPFAPVANVAEVAVEMMLDGQTCINTFHFLHQSGAISIFDITNLAQAVDNLWDGDIMINLSEQVQQIQVRCRDLTSEFGVASSSSVHQNNGSITGNCAANNVSFAIKRVTGLSGRGNRGRVYVVGIPESKITANTIDSTWAGDLVAAFAGFKDDLTALDWVEVLVHSQVNGVPLNPRTATAVEDYAVANLVADSQRRRLPGRGS